MSRATSRSAPVGYGPRSLLNEPTRRARLNAATTGHEPPGAAWCRGGERNPAAGRGRCGEFGRPAQSSAAQAREVGSTSRWNPPTPRTTSTRFCRFCHSRWESGRQRTDRPSQALRHLAGVDQLVGRRGGAGREHEVTGGGGGRARAQQARGQGPRGVQPEGARREGRHHDRRCRTQGAPGQAREGSQEQPGRRDDFPRRGFGKRCARKTRSSRAARACPGSRRPTPPSRR
jgi:hypothetical protein